MFKCLTEQFVDYVIKKSGLKYFACALCIDDARERKSDINKVNVNFLGRLRSLPILIPYYKYNYRKSLFLVCVSKRQQTRSDL